MPNQLEAVYFPTGGLLSPIHIFPQVRKLRGGVFVGAGHDLGLRPVKPTLFRASPSKTKAISGFAPFYWAKP